MIKKKAFTLAEVLITLGVIGVVAAMTLPTLIQKYKRVVVETQLRREYALIANAVKWAEVDNGTDKSGCLVGVVLAIGQVGG